MKSNYYNFFGKLLLEVKGEGGRSTSQFRTMYKHFEVSNPEGDPDIVVERTTEPISSELVLGLPEKYYGWTGSRFVVKKGPEYMAVEPGWKHIYVTPNWEPFYAIYPVEFMLRSTLALENRALIHASGIELDGKTILFPSWRGGGKTNTLMSLLDAGGNYLADDRLWVGADGSVQGFPLTVNLQPFNIESFPSVQEQFGESDTSPRRRVSQYIEQNIDPKGSIVGKALTFLNRYYLKERSRSFTDIPTVFPDAEYVDQSAIDAMVFLTAAPEQDHVSLTEMTTNEAVMATQAISYYEWNERLEEYFRAYDSLVPDEQKPDGSAVEQLTHVIDTERKVFEKLYNSVETYRASIPRKTNWNESGTDREIVETIQSIGFQPEIEAGD
ncbi:hypothetical protein ACH9L7_17290 (plasmid) [Haloferax sp. S1W]|uniref:hypothetical protein n=1 Tax=Haloferax sp. S1W TaxID=3377110 RepID=UPI0037C681C5